MKKILGILFLLLSFSAFSQIKFQKVFGESTATVVYGTEQTSDSGYILAGYSGLNLKDFCLIKTDINGNVIWTKSYDSGADEEARAVQQTSDGGFIMCGTAWFSVPFTHIYIYVIKTNEFGDTLWTKFYYQGGGEFGYSIKQTIDKGYIITGEVLDTVTFYSNAYLLKIDSVGNLIWSKSYGNADEDAGIGATETPDSGFVLIGNLTNLGMDYIFFTKIDSMGNITVNKTYDVSGNATAFKQTADGGYIIAANTGDALLLKIDSVGNILWSKSYGGLAQDLVYSIFPTYDNGYIFSGATTSFGDVWGDYYLVRCDSLGNVLWSRTYGGVNEDYSYAVQQTVDSGFIATGITNGLTIMYTNIYYIKTDGEGNTGCNEDTAATVVSAVNVQLANIPINVYPTNTTTMGTNTNIVVRGSSRELCSSVNTNYLIKDKGIQISPNPFHTSAKIEIGNKELGNGHWELRIFNTLGVLVREEHVSNSDSCILHRNDLCDGLYFYELISTNSELIGTGKFIIE